ncbi:LysR family transcriptional regulator [Aestuariivita sp.]|jgi:DNA-binding transcriptional LysR family regulator|uniref:LysR family transcriptional regulator n=1 Tax=Aestuariivita sp. TaxID=1872407 RepID=UPI00216FA703|nr:LysR family transcriptional regulator [Aestuariivita sp.]MCE8008714.1 LysR family transcriptional regulator [Aestuariivita sp.]
MELRHLRYFVAVAEHGGISHAAERLNIAQPAVSRQIRDLEMELGFDLLLREGRRVVLTDAGRSFADRARAILKDTEDAAETARRISKGEAGSLKIGLLEAASWAGHLPLTLNRFKRKHDGIRLDIRPMSSVAQIDALLSGEIDAAFVYRQDNISNEALAVHPLRTDNVVLAASTDLVFDSDGTLAFEDIDGLPIVAFPRSVAPAYHDQLFGALKGIGFEAQIVQEAMDETTMLSLVSAGVGCAFVNSTNMQRPPRRVQFRKVEGLSVPIEFLFVTPKSPGSLTQLLTDTVLEIDTQKA